MIVAIVGPASCLANAAIDAGLRFMNRYVGETRLVTSDDISELGRNLAGDGRSHVLFHCSEPAQELMLAFKRANIPVLIVIDEPWEHLAYLVDALGAAWHGAFRDYMRLMCILQPVVVDPYFWLLRRADAHRSLAGWLARSFRNAETLENIAAFMSEHVSLTPCVAKTAQGPCPVRSGDEIRASLPPLARIEIETALADYLPTLERRRIEKIMWRRQLFSVPDLPFGANNIRIDTTGKARHLVFGPYFHIPAGDWRTVMRFAVENALSGFDLMFDVFDIGRNEILFEGELRTSPKTGAYACEFEFTVVDATSLMEVRVFMKSGSIEGFFVFGDLDLIRVDGARTAPVAHESYSEL